MSTYSDKLTVREAATLLGISASGVYYLVSKNKIPAHRYYARGGITLCAADLVRYAKEHKDVYSDAIIERMEAACHDA